MLTGSSAVAVRETEAAGFQLANALNFEARCYESAGNFLFWYNRTLAVIRCRQSRFVIAVVEQNDEAEEGEVDRREQKVRPNRESCVRCPDGLASGAATAAPLLRTAVAQGTPRTCSQHCSTLLVDACSVSPLMDLDRYEQARAKPPLPFPSCVGG